MNIKLKLKLKLPLRQRNSLEKAERQAESRSGNIRCRRPVPSRRCPSSPQIHSDFLAKSCVNFQLRI